ncbi:MAG: galactose mutarotase [Methylobacteriaceae bacterium]|nr:galactose mutarotase [Methylobacteriaceae bacterium]
MNVRTAGQFNGAPVHEIELANSAGAKIRVLTWGAVVRDFVLPTGRHIVLGFDSFDPYPIHSRSFGAIIGRFANRIADACFSLDGHTYELTRNDGGIHHLHGGAGAFGKRVWSLTDASATHVTLALDSQDGDSGYPGTMQATCTYTLTDFATLKIELSATTDRATIVNLTHHGYFNLAGQGNVGAHKLWLNASFYTPVGPDSIPTGEICPVQGTACDFTGVRDIGSSDIDINFVLNRPLASERVHPLTHAATLHAPDDALRMEVWTSEPGLQVYNGFKLDVDVPGINGERYKARSGIALETQRFPNSPNVPHFSKCTLREDEIYRQHTEYRVRAHA